ncbi:MAG: hypothetical protein V2J24_18645 [Pseudomonadales bacterium]|jgi:uncharacterized repeat protein (TIGR01451 family)|nr:hypothetical protein [Pseudomonadales bacterium]
MSTRLVRKVAAIVAACLYSGAVHAEVFNVSNPAEFQSALTAAQSNGQDDVINVAVCSGTGCTTQTFEPRPGLSRTVTYYDLSTPLTYVATSTEARELVIQGVDSLTRAISSSSGSTPLLRIDTTAATVDGIGPGVELSGITFAFGDATGTTSDEDGGAVAIRADGNVSVLASEFYGSEAGGRGGALYIRAAGLESAITLRDLTVAGNTAAASGGGAYVAAGAFSAVNVIDIDFIENTAGTDGGGFVVEGLLPANGDRSTGELSVFDVGVEDNVAGTDGGGAFLSARSHRVEKSGFTGNTAGGLGGGLFVAGNWQFFNMINSGAGFNTATLDGGGVYLDTPSLGFGGAPNLINDTLLENTAGGDGGNVYVAATGTTSTVRLYNNIIYDGSATGEGDDAYIDNRASVDVVPVEVFNNAITTLPAGDDFTNVNDAWFVVPDGRAAVTSGGNIADAPLLVLATTDDEGFDIISPDQLPASPTIDAGRNDIVGTPFDVSIPVDDYDSQARPDGDVNSGGIVDIGMDEFVPDAAPTADLAVVATDSPDPVTEGTALTYTATVSNAGPDAATSVDLDVGFDVDVEFASATPGQGTCTPVAGEVLGVSCDLGTIADGDDVVVTLVVTAPDVVEPGSITAFFSVASDGQNDPDVSDNDTIVQTTVAAAGPAQADLTVTKNAAPDPFVSRSGELTWTVTVQNNGPDPATGVIVTDTLPAGVDFVSATLSTDGSCDGPDTSGTLTCTIGALGVSENATVTIVVVPDDVTESTTITNTASVAGNELDPNADNDSSSVETTIEPPSADLSVTVSASSEAPTIGSTVTYTVTVSSAGPSTSEDVVLEIDLPAGTTLSSFTSASGTCSSSAGTLSCDLAALAAGESVNVQLQVVMPDVTGVRRLVALVSSDTGDPTAANDTASQEVNVIDTIDLVVRGTGGSSSAVGWLELLFGGSLLTFVRRRGKRRVTAPALGLLLVSSLATAPSSARADDWYVTGGAGLASAGYRASDLTADLAARGWTIRDVSVDDTDRAWRLGLGYEFTDRFAVEGGYVDLGTVETRYGTTIQPTQIDALLQDTFDVHTYLGRGWTLGGAARLPLGDGPASAVLRGGAFFWDADIEVEVIQGGSGRVAGEESGVGAYFGVGFELEVAPRVRMTFDWDRYDLDDWVDVPSIGVRVSF